MSVWWPRVRIYWAQFLAPGHVVCVGDVAQKCVCRLRHQLAWNTDRFLGAANQANVKPTTALRQVF